MRTVETRDVFVGKSLGLCDYVRTVETRGTEPQGGHEDILSRGAEPWAGAEGSMRVTGGAMA